MGGRCGECLSAMWPNCVVFNDTVIVGRLDYTTDHLREVIGVR
jgi:hypothetical protein